MPGVKAINFSLDLGQTLCEQRIRAHGNVHPARTMSEWLGICLYADVCPMA
jgi:hypothetical protein